MRMPGRQMSSGNNAFVSAIAPTTPGAAARILQHNKASKLTTNQVRNRPFLKFPVQTTARTSSSSPQIYGRNDAFASTLTPAQPCRLTALRILRTSHHGQSTKSLAGQINHLCHIIRSPFINKEAPIGAALNHSPYCLSASAPYFTRPPARLAALSSRSCRRTRFACSSRSSS